MSYLSFLLIPSGQGLLQQLFKGVGGEDFDAGMPRVRIVGRPEAALDAAALAAPAAAQGCAVAGEQAIGFAGSWG